MKLGVAGPTLLLTVVLGCSACGGAHTARQSTTTTRTTTVAKVTPVTLGHDLNFVILPPIHGAGDETLGTFTVAGRYGDIEVQCTGGGPIKVAGLWTVPCRSGGGETLGFDTVGERINLTVRAKPGTTWWLAVGEHIPTLVHPTLLLAHRTGAGKASLGARCRHVRPLNPSPNPCRASLGTFRLHGILHVATSCTGHGQLVVSISFLSKRPDNTFSDDYCPMNDTVQTFPATDGKVRVAVTRAPKGTWEITLRETPAK